MKKDYIVPELEIRNFNTESIATLSADLGAKTYQEALKSLKENGGITEADIFKFVL